MMMMVDMRGKENERALESHYMCDGKSQADMIHVDMPRHVTNKSNRRVENQGEARGDWRGKYHP